MNGPGEPPNHDGWEAGRAKRDGDDGGAALITRAPGRLIEQGRVIAFPTEAGHWDDEAQPAFDLLDYWGIFLKRRWLILGALASGLALGVAVTLLTTPVYRATTTIQIDHEPAKVVALQSQQTDSYYDNESFYPTEYALLKSDALARRVASNLGLAHDTTFLNQPRPAAGSRTATDSAAALNRAASIVAGGVKINPVHGSRLVQVSFDSPNPDIAAKVANGVADNFIASSLERRYDASSYARQFLLDRLNQTRQKLEDTERQMVAYAGKNQLITVGAGDGSKNSGAAGETSLAETNLSSINTALAAAISTRIQAEQRWRQAELTPDMALPEVLANPSIGALQQSRDALNTQYEQDRHLFKPDYPTMVDMKSKIDTINRQIATQAKSIKDSLRNQYNVALRQEQSLSAAVGQQKGAVMDFRSKSIQYNILQRELDTSRSIYDGLLQRYKEIGLAGGVGENNVSIVDRAKTPGAPFEPSPVRNIGLFGAVALGLGCLLAFLLERFDVTVKVPEDIERWLQIAMLGAVPKLPKTQVAEDAGRDPRSVLSEAYYSIRTALQFSTEDGVPTSLLITSARPNEGKSTSALTLARAFARIGMRVLLVDGDMRAPSLHKILACDLNVGLSNILSGGSVEGSVVQATDQANLMFLACGPRPPNPAELLGGERMKEFLKTAKEEFDLVIIDGPPVLGLADGPLLASIVGGTVIVVEAGVTKRQSAKTAVGRLRVARAHVIGAVLNKFDVRKAGFSYSYHYGHETGYGYGYDYGSPAQTRSRLFGIQLPAPRTGNGRKS